MSVAQSLPDFASIVVAAGAGLRADQSIPKQFASYKGKPLVRHSVEALLGAGASPLVVVIPEDAEDVLARALAGLNGWSSVTGGATRQQSVFNGLKAVSGAHHVLIHDAARPDVPASVIKQLLATLDINDGAIPVLHVVDSLVVAQEGVLQKYARREDIRRVQTPQAFRYDAIMKAHQAWTGEQNAGDDAQVLVAAGGTVALVTGDKRLMKMTYASDFVAATPAIRVGTGFDVHRLADGEELWLCGVKIEHSQGLAGHSDADVALHAIVDALLGAIGAGDIGSHFPPSDPRWRGAASDQFLDHANRLIKDAGYVIGNIDLTIICEAPKIGPHREAMRNQIARILDVALDCISVKATTTERLGFTGRGEGIAAQAVASVVRV